MGKWLDRLTKDPTDWLLEKGCASIRFRTLTEIHGRGADDPDVVAAREEVYTYKPPHTISTAQSDDGTWFGSLLGFEALNLNRKRGPGTISQYLALIEYGWGKDHPIVWRCSEKLLQGLLWEDPGIDLCELKGYCGGDPAVEVYLRKKLSRIALGLMSRTGLLDDIGVKRKSAELIKELDAFYQGDVHSKIVTGELTRPKDTEDGPVDEICTVLSPDAHIPNLHLLLWFAFNTNLREDELAQDVLQRIGSYMFEHPHGAVEVVSVGGKVFDRERDLAIRSLNRSDYEEEKLLGRLLQDLELLARCGILEKVPKAVELLEWVISLQDADGIVEGGPFIEKVFNRIDYPFFPLEDNWRGKFKKFTDITFRLFMILSILDSRSA